MKSPNLGRADVFGVWLFILVFCLGSFLSVRSHFRDRGVGAINSVSSEVIREVSMPQSQKLVALTFDDGPNPYYTPQILKILAKYRAHATFFVVGKQAEQFPELLAAESRRKNQIGNHGYRHIDYRQLSPQQVMAEVDKSENIIERATKLKPTVFRPPLGKYRNYMIEMLQARNYSFILWTYSTNSEDSWLNPSADTIVQKIVGGIHPGSIILLHDHGGNRRSTVDALEQVLKTLIPKGYKFVTLDTLLEVSSKPLKTVTR